MSSGLLVAVTGRPGSGVSTTAIALAQGLAGCSRVRRAVLLADLSWRSDQALLHDVASHGPGIDELLAEASTAVSHGASVQRVDLEAEMSVRSLAQPIDTRAYDLLIGPDRRTRKLEPPLEAHLLAIDVMKRDYHAVIADLDDDFAHADEGHRLDGTQSASISRQVIAAADAVVIVGAASLAGLGGLLRAVSDLHRCGVSPSRVRPVVSRAPKRRRALQQTNAVDALITDDALIADAVASPERPELETAHRDASAMPQSFVDTVLAAVPDVAAALRYGDALTDAHTDPLTDPHTSPSAGGQP